jgi:hypothetical protein
MTRTVRTCASVRDPREIVKTSASRKRLPRDGDHIASSASHQTPGPLPERVDRRQAHALSTLSR